MSRVSGRRSRSYNVASESPYLPDEGHKMYRRIVVAIQRLPETSISVRCFIRKESGIRGHRRERWRDPSVVGIVCPRRPRNDLKSVSPF